MSNISDPHIKNFYEDLNFEIDDIESIINDAFTGKLCNATEKIDGQNFTFTVVNNEVKFMGKGSAKWIRKKGGLNKLEMVEHLAGKGNIADVFASAYDAVQQLINNAPADLALELFENGKCVIQADIISSKSRNIVIYAYDNVISLTCAYRLDTSVSSNFKQDLIKKLLDVTRVTENFYGWTFIGIKPVEFKPYGDIFKDLNSCMNEYALIKSQGHKTVYDYLMYNAVNVLRTLIPNEEYNYKRIARRIITESASGAHLKEFSKITASAISMIEKHRANFMRMASKDLIKATTKISNHILKCYEFSMSNVDENVAVIKAVSKVARDYRSYSSNMDFVNDINSLKDTFSIDDYNLNTEGIVFEWKNIPRKLTGGFTGINKFNGLLVYLK